VRRSERTVCWVMVLPPMMTRPSGGSAGKRSGLPRNPGPVPVEVLVLKPEEHALRVARNPVDRHEAMRRGAIRSDANRSSMREVKGGFTNENTTPAQQAKRRRRGGRRRRNDRRDRQTLENENDSLAPVHRRQGDGASDTTAAGGVWNSRGIG